MHRRWSATCCTVLAYFGLALGCLVGVLAHPAPSGAATGRTEILDFGYAPGEIVVVPGDAVVWSNNGATAHSVTPDGGSEAFGARKLPPGKSHVYTFSRLGTYAYHCDIYPSMRGVVRVVDPASTTTTTSRPGRAPFGSATVAPSTVRVVPPPPSTAAPAPTASAAGVGSSPAAPASKPRAPQVPSAGTVPVAPRASRTDLSALSPSTVPVQPPAGLQEGSPSPGTTGAGDAMAGDSRDRGKAKNAKLALVGQILFAAGAVLLLSGVRPRRR